MTRFPLHTPDTAPAGSRETLAAATAAWGFTPHLHAKLAESPIALKGYDTLFNLVASEATLSPVEQQVVYQAANVFHGCEYCTAGHTALSRRAGMEESVLQALRNQQPIADARLQALRSFTETVLETRGAAGATAVEPFLAAGFTPAQVLEVVTIIATKTISNYANFLTQTPLETFMKDPALLWRDPQGRMERPELATA
jgi:AhpD family alkylhydroperoxidase